MKKILAFVLAAIMMLTLLAGCSNGGNAEKKEGLENFKIGFIFLHDENSTYDKNFIDAAKPLAQTLVFPMIRFL